MLPPGRERRDRACGRTRNIINTMNDLQTLTSATEPPLVRKLHAVGRRLGTPVSGTFELTAGCNFNCKMCYIHEENAVPRGDGELTAAQWLQIGRQAADAGTVFVLLTGGEPLLRPDFAEIYTGLKQLGLMVSVNTNGALLTGETAALLERNPPMRLNVSLYADSGEGYLRVCGTDAFETVTGNIRRMKAAGIEVKLNISFCKYNADRCAQIAALVRELGLHCQASVYMYPPVRKASAAAYEARLSAREAADLRLRWELLRGKNDAVQNSARQLELLQTRECADPDLPIEGVRCRAGHTSYWISADGQMLMCGMIPVPAGFVPEEGFERCWQNTRALMKSVAMPAKCTACSLRPVCCVCPAACYAETGGFSEAPPYLCDMSSCLGQAILRFGKEGATNETE